MSHVLRLEIDTGKGELRLPKEKLERLVTLLASWEDRKACTLKELELLIGHLNHACKVVCPGRSFHIRHMCMIDLLCGSQARRRKAATIRLNRGFRSDLGMVEGVHYLLEWGRIPFTPALHRNGSRHRPRPH